MDTLELRAGTVDLRALRFDPREGEPVALSGREVELLRYLAERAGETVDRERLYAEVWGYDAGVVSRALDASVRRLRNKIERDPANPDHLLTIHGEGYRFETAGVEPAPPAPRRGTLAAVGLDPAAGFDATFSAAAVAALVDAGGEPVLREGDEVVARFASPARAVVWGLRLVDAHASARAAASHTDDVPRLQRLLAATEAGRVALTEALHAEVETATVVRDRAWRAMGLVRLSRTEAPEPIVVTGDDAHEAELGAGLGPLVGRADALAGALEALEAPLVTLTGTGGVGKTRLAREVAASWPAGTWFAELSPCHTERDVAAAVARALRMPAGRHVDPTPCLRALPDDLVVLDNAEHVLDAVRAQVARWAGAGARLLVTSREPLGVAGEVVVHLEPLAVDDGAALLEARVRALGLDPGPPDELRALASRLDGLPLALELVAETVGLVGPSAVHSAGAALAPVVKGSWDRLDEPLRALLSACAVFRAPFTVEDVEAVADGPVTQGLLALRRKGLVRLEPDRRLSVYVAVREHVPVPDALRDRHARWFARRGAETVPARMASPTGQALLARLTRELPDLLAAVEHGLAHDPPLAVGAFLGAAQVLRAHGPVEDVEPLGIAVLPYATPAEQVRIHAARAVYGSPPERLEAIAQALARLDGPTALGLRVELALMFGRLDEARALLTAFKAASGDDLLARTQATQQEVDLLERAARWGDAAELLEQALAGHRKLGNVSGEIGARLRLATCWMRVGKLDRAFAEVRRASEEAARLTDPRLRAGASFRLGQIHALRGEVDAAIEAMRAAQPQMLRAGNLDMAIVNANNLAVCLGTYRDTTEALLVTADALADARAAGFAEDEALLLGNLGWLELCEGHVDDSRSRLEQAVVRHRELDRPSVLAIHAAYLAKARRLSGDLRGAREAADEAVGVASSGHDPRALVGALGQRAVVFAAMGDAAAARGDLEAAAEALPRVRSVPDELGLAACRVEVLQLLGDGAGAEAELRHLRRDIDRHGFGPRGAAGREAARLGRSTV